jgi:hypothetical protein
VTGGALRHAERCCELRRARGALVQERDDPAAGRVSEGAELLGLVDDEEVIEVVVGRLVDDRGTYGIRRLFARK